MEFKLNLLLFGATILWLSSVNGQIIQPSYSYYGQRQNFEPYFLNPTPRPIITLVASDPRILETLRRMSPEELQRIVNDKMYTFLEDYNVPSGAEFDVNVQNGKFRTRGNFYPSPLPIRRPALTNIRPTTLVYPGPYGLNALNIGGIGRLGPSLMGRSIEYYQVGRPKTRSVDSEYIRESTFSGDDVPSSSSLKSSAKVVDLHKIDVRANDNNQGSRKEENFQNPNLDENEISNQIAAAVKSEILYLLRNMDKDDLQNFRNSNISMYTAGPYINQSINPPRPMAPFFNNYDNNGWKPRSGGLNSNNYNSWWTNSYNYPRVNGRNWNIGYNYQLMNNAQLGNPNYNIKPMNNGQLGNSNYNYQPMNNGQLGNPNYNYQPMFTIPKITDQPVKPNYNVPPVNNTGGPGNVNNSVPSMNNNRQPGNFTFNHHPVNITERPENPNYNGPPTNPTRPGVLYPSLKPYMNSETPDSSNQFAQNYPKSTSNTPPYNNDGTFGYSMNGDYRGPPKVSNPIVDYSQGQLPFNGNILPNYQYQMPATTFFKSSPQIYNPYEWYTREMYS